MKKNRSYVKYGIFLFFIIFCLSILFVLYTSMQTGFVKKFPYYTNQWVFVQKDRNLLKGFNEIDGNYYVFDQETGIMEYGFKDINNQTYYFGEDGKAVKGLQTIDNDTYYFKDDATLQKNAWYHQNQQISYSGKDGKFVTGYQTLNEKTYLFDEKGNLSVDTQALQKGYEEILSYYSGNVGIYFEDLRTHQSVSINDVAMYPCCMIKVPGLAAVYQEAEKGNVSIQENAYHIDKMISISDNSSFNIMMNKIGGMKSIEIVNTLCKDLGMDRTEFHHALRPGSHVFSDGGENVSCPSDIGKILRALYEGKLVSEQSSQEMIGVLKGCRDTLKLRTGIPYTVDFAHKTGDTITNHHDGGIVYLPGNEYILVVFSEHVPNFENLMYEISNYTYQFQNESRVEF